MIECFRAFLDRPLGPAAGRAILALATAIFVGFAAVFLLAGGEPHGVDPATVTSPPTAAEPGADQLGLDAGASNRAQLPKQDPQDRPGSAAARRVASALRERRALQHVPYSIGAVSIVLVGADRGRAVLRISAATRAAARRGWHEFLDRFEDRGSLYKPQFVGTLDRGRRPR